MTHLGPVEATVAPRRVGQQPATGPAVRDVLGWPGFDVEVIAGASGLDRVIRIAHATELRDPSAFLRGDELIMTVGSELRSAHDCDVFVQSLHRSRAAGIALAFDVAGHPTPPWLAPAAERVGIAVLSVPRTLPFIVFTERLQELADARGEQERLRREDGRMLDFVRRGHASPQVLRDRFPDAEGREYQALCLAPHSTTILGGVVVEGWIDAHTVVVLEEPYARSFLEHPSVPVFGIGGPVPFVNLARTLRECFAAFAIASRRGASAGPRDLATMTGLLERLTVDQLAPFRDHVIAPLRRFDARTGRGLVRTLEVFLEEDGRLEATALRLSVHGNTVRNRLGRIRTLTGLDPFSFADRVALTVAVRSDGAGSVPGLQ